jgi:hypothetical protein
MLLNNTRMQAQYTYYQSFAVHSAMQDISSQGLL